jgi:hypothetical protein
MCYDNGYRNEETVNSLRLLDSYKNFVTFKDDTRSSGCKKEADLLRPYFEAELKQIIADLRQEIQNERCPGRCRWKSIRTTKISPCAPWACRAWARWASPLAWSSPWIALRTPARGISLGQHAVARDEPRVHPHRDQFSRAALVHRRPRGPRRNRSFARVGRPHHARRGAAIRDKKLAARRGPRPRFHSPRIPESGDRVLLSGGPHLRLHQGRWGADKLLDMVHSFARSQDHARCDPQDLGMAPEEFDKQFLEWLDKDVGKTVANFDQWRATTQGPRRASQRTKITTRS